MLSIRIYGGVAGLNRALSKSITRETSCHEPRKQQSTIEYLIYFGKAPAKPPSTRAVPYKCHERS